jgi:hypothetical protein
VAVLLSCWQFLSYTDISKQLLEMHSLPSWVKEALPRIGLTVQGLQTDLNGPPTTHALIYKPAKDCFSSSLPTADSWASAFQSMPPASWLIDANNIKEQQQAAGAQSIEDLQKKGVRHPIEVLEFWSAWKQRNETRELWNKRDQWLNAVAKKYPKLTHQTHEACSLFESIPCEGQVKVLQYGVDISSLGNILSDEYTNDDVVNLYMSYLRQRASGSDDQHVRNRVHVVSSQLYAAIHDETRRGSTIHDKVKRVMIVDGRTHLVFPACHDMHWVACVLSMTEKMLFIGELTGTFKSASTYRRAIGDSRASDIPTPSDISRNIQRWCVREFGFKPELRELPHGKQVNSNTCGYACINTIEHYIERVPLYTHQTRYEHRIRTFVRLIQLMIEQVSLASYFRIPPMLTLNRMPMLERSTRLQTRVLSRLNFRSWLLHGRLLAMFSL